MLTSHHIDRATLCLPNDVTITRHGWMNHLRLSRRRPCRIRTRHRVLPIPLKRIRARWSSASHAL